MRTSDYLRNSAFHIFDEKQRAEIERWFNYTQERKDLAYSYYDKDSTDHTFELLSHNYFQELKGARLMLESLGAKIAYDWVGHRNKWFFPTEEDVEVQLDWEYQCADYYEE
jgi:hypothetical protein